jgi:monoamine oxidase
MSRARINISDTMRRFSRRTFLAGSAAVLGMPALVRAQSGDVDVVVIGAGAAGIAAARRLAVAKVRFALIEAGERVGGRCVTDTATFGVPFDRGAHWIHRPQGNELVTLAQGSGLDLYPAPRSEKLRVPPRRAREGEVEDFLAALVRANRAIVEAGRRGDGPAAAALPRDLGPWQDSVAFVLGPYSVGRALGEVSAADFARAPERVADAFCREGYGTLLARLARPLPVQLNTPARKIDWRSGLAVETPKGTLRARAIIVTVSTGVLGSGALAFEPELPAPYGEAVRALSPGYYEQVGLELPGNPLGLDKDDVVFEQAAGERTAALLGNIGGSPLCMVSVGGGFALELARGGDAAMTAFAAEWLGKAFGSEAKGHIKRASATRWSLDPLARGAFSVAAPGRAGARRVMQQPLRERIWFAGEASHDTLWGTVNGAWESGSRAAEAALHAVGALKEPKAEPEPKRRRRRRD